VAFLWFACCVQMLETTNGQFAYETGWDLSGRVVSESGQPLLDVAVSNTSGSKTTKTDKDGRYVLPFHSGTVGELCCAVRFFLPSYQPLWKSIDAGARHLDVVLKSGENQWTPMRCGPSQKPKRIGLALRLLIPEGTYSQHTFDVDVFRDEIFFGPEQHRERMEQAGGPLWGSPLSPPDHKLASSYDIQERRVACGRGKGVDFRGHDKEGLRWRYISMFDESIEYEKVSSEAADFFDSIIDSLCCTPFPPDPPR
jgi:hypothetical protein